MHHDDKDGIVTLVMYSGRRFKKILALQISPMLIAACKGRALPATERGGVGVGWGGGVSG